MGHDKLTTVKAIDIEQGEHFRKKTGTMVYLRISLAALNFYGITDAVVVAGVSKVYGVCHNGNMTRVDGDTEVVPMPASAMEDNRLDGLSWDVEIRGGRENVDSPPIPAAIDREPGEVSKADLDWVRETHEKLMVESSLYREAERLHMVGLMFRMQLTELRRQHGEKPWDRKPWDGPEGDTTNG